MANLDQIANYLADGVKSVRFTPTWAKTPTEVYGHAYYSPLTGTVRMYYMLYYSTAQNLQGQLLATIPEEYRPPSTYSGISIVQSNIGTSSPTTRAERIYLQSSGSLYVSNFVGTATSVKLISIIIEWPLV